MRIKDSFVIENSEGARTTPSIIHMKKKGEIHVGIHGKVFS